MSSGLAINRLLAKIPESEQAVLERQAEWLPLPAGATLAAPGERLTSVYYPTSGVISVISTSTSGRHFQIAAVGSEGFIGLGIVLNIQPAQYWYSVLVDSTGYRMTEEVFQQALMDLPGLRRETLDYTGRILQRTIAAAVCNRFHTQEQRLARWLLELTEKSGRQEFDFTHEDIAQLIGGPRHAVTAALGALRQAGVVEYGRGRLTVVDRRRLASCTCECATVEDFQTR